MNNSAQHVNKLFKIAVGLQHQQKERETVITAENGCGSGRGADFMQCKRGAKNVLTSQKLTGKMYIQLNC